jgi:hypothetical protein
LAVAPELDPEFQEEIVKLYVAVLGATKEPKRANERDVPTSSVSSFSTYASSRTPVSELDDEFLS